MASTQIYKGDPRPGIPPCVMVLSAMGLKLGIFRFFLPTTHTQKQNAKQVPRWSLCTVLHFNTCYLHTQTVVDRGDICTWRTMVILITRKIRIPPIWVPCRDQNGAGSGISLVYLSASMWSSSLKASLKLKTYAECNFIYSFVFSYEKKGKNCNFDEFDSHGHVHIQIPPDRLRRSPITQYRCGYCNWKYHWGYYAATAYVVASVTVASEYPQTQRYSNLQ